MTLRVVILMVMCHVCIREVVNELRYGYTHFRLVQYGFRAYIPIEL